MRALLSSRSLVLALTASLLTGLFPAFAGYPEVGTNDQVLSASGYYTYPHRSLTSAHDPVRNEYFVAFYGRTGSAIPRIYGFFVNGSDGATSAVFELSDTGVGASNPNEYWPSDLNIDIAFSPEHDRYLAVWAGDQYPDAQGAGPHDEIEIRGRIINPVTRAPEGGRINISRMPTDNSLAAHPSVAWSAAGDTFWVAWTAYDTVEGTEVFAEAISAAGIRLRGEVSPRRISTHGSTAQNNAFNYAPQPILPAATNVAWWHGR